jgi:PAS domain S-box-containing protein
MFEWDIQKKIIAGFVGIITSMFVFAGFGLYTIKILHTNETVCEAVNSIKTAILECRIQEGKFFSGAPDAKIIAVWKRQIDQIKNFYQDKEIRSQLSSQDNRIFSGVIDDYERQFNALLGDFEKRNLSVADLSAYTTQLQNLGYMLEETSEGIFDKLQLRDEKLDRQAMFIFVVIAVAGVLISLLLGYSVIKYIRKGLKKIGDLNKELADHNLELGIGVSEHFEVLRRVAAGDLEVKAPENSKNELIAKLGAVINQTIGRLIMGSRRELEDVYSIVTSGVRVVDLNFNVIRMNRVMRILSGLTDGGGAEYKCYEQFKGEFCHTDKCTLRQILSGKENVGIEIEKDSCDGKKIFCSLKAVPFRNEKAEIIGIVEEYTDISELRRIQRELEMSGMELAVGMSEIFEVLNKAAKGDLNIRANLKSNNELLVQLGILVNQMISSLKESWSELEMSRLYTENIIKSLSDTLIVVNEDNTIESVNYMACYLLGYSQEELQGQLFGKIIPEEEAASLRVAVTEVLPETGQIKSYSTCCQRKNGERIPVLLSGSMMLDKTNKKTHLVFTLKDITDIKNAEKELQRTYLIQKVINDMLSIPLEYVSFEEMLELVMNKLMNISWLMLELRGTIFFVEDEPGVLVKKATWGMAHSQEHVCSRVPFGRCLCGRAAESGKIEFSDRVDERHENPPQVTGPHGHYCVPIMYSGKVLGVINLYLKEGHVRNAQEESALNTIANILAEMIQRKRSVDELRHAYEQLKDIQSKLLQAEKMSAIGQLAGGVAHEINNPLTGVLNNVQLVKMIAQDEKEFSMNEFKEYLDVIEESALRCKKITESLLNFSHSSLGSKQPLSLNELVEKVTILIEHEMNLQNIVIRKEFNPQLQKVMGDSQLLQQVIFNIISNAKYAIDKKFGKAGGLIYINTQCHEGDNRVCLCISDNGSGISKDKIEKIFEPFFTTKPVGEGTGLGLSVAYSIIKEHNGLISVESKENEGTTFKICLPGILEGTNV